MMKRIDASLGITHDGCLLFAAGATIMCDGAVFSFAVLLSIRDSKLKLGSAVK